MGRRREEIEFTSLSEIKSLTNGDEEEALGAEESNGRLTGQRSRVRSQDHSDSSRFLRWDKVAKSSYLNYLLLASPFAIISYFANWGAGPTFILSLLALIPQAQLLGLFTEQVAFYTNEAIGGLLNATFGNLTELIISVVALNKGLLNIVKMSLMGSILSNCLLVMGSAFIVGGISHKSQRFNIQMASTNSGLLMMCVLAIAFPAVMVETETNRSAQAVLTFSRLTAFTLLSVYGLLMLFQIKTHRHLVEGDREADEDEDEEEEQFLSWKESVIWLFIDAVFISGFSKLLVDSIEGSVKDLGISKMFIGVILIPIVGNAAEHAAAVMVAYRGRMELAMGIALGSAVQISLFGIPVVVIAAWIMNRDLDLNFSLFQTVVLSGSVLTVGLLVADGKSNYLKGAMLVSAYLIIAAAFYAHKDL
ncbi:hypothetical protein AAMO2058_001528400 [Amorphochlora amoebiformis]